MTEAASELQVQALANLLLLQQRLRGAHTEAELGFVLVNDTQSLLPYRSAVLWLANSASVPGGSIVSVSGAVDHDGHSPYVQWMKALCREVSSAENPDIRELRREDLPEKIAGEWDAHGASVLLWCPLRSPGGASLGALVLWREKPLIEAEQRILGNWLEAASYSIAALRGKAFAGRRLAWTPRSKRMAAALLMTLVLVMFMPVRLSVLAQAEIVALDPLVVRSPLDGIVSVIDVRPNSPVEEGQRLLKLDDSELQTRLEVAQQTLAISRAQYQQASQSASFDRDAKASLRVLALENEKFEAEVAYVRSLIDRSDVEAEQGGVVMMPSPDELIGKPVVIGERLMTIADPERTQLELWLPVGDDIDLPYDTSIDFFPNVAPDKSFAAALRTMDYRATATDTGELAYRIRAEFTDGDKLPRIGMRGTARLYGEKVSLAYYLFRRPLATVRRWTGL